MPSLARGESSTSANPVLDLFVAIGLPLVLSEIVALEFQIFDISTPTKRVTPVLVFPASGFETLDPTTAPPTGHRLSVGHYFAPYTVDLAEPIGDHKIVWQFRKTALAPLEVFEEEFFVTQASLPSAAAYCSVGDLRAEGYSEAFVVNPVTQIPLTVSEFDARVTMLIELATRYVDKATGRWFTPITFDDTNRFVVDGVGGWRSSPFNVRSGGKVLHLMIPIIRLDKLFIRSDGTFNPTLTEISLDGQLVQVYNRHLTGLRQPDDREDPRIAFTNLRVVETVASGLFPSPHIFPEGRLNVHLEGVFGYTEPDGSAFGKTPELIRQVTCRLVARDLLFDADACEKFTANSKFRITSDKEGSTTIKLQDLWLKGAFTGDPVIDNILMMYKRPPRIAVV